MSAPLGRLQANFYKPADGLRTAGEILLPAAPIIDLGEHRIVPPHADLSANPGFGAAP